MSGLRRFLAEGAGSADVLVTRGRGYALVVDPATIDALRFEQAVEEARGHAAQGQHHDAAARLGRALALWRGEAFADAAYCAFAQDAIRRLEELRLLAQEEHAQALLDAGRPREVVPHLEAFVTRHPLRERPTSQLMLALHQTGRSADALAVHSRYRGMLADEFGLDPSAAIEDLALSILRQDPSLGPEQGVFVSRPDTTVPGPSADGDAGLIGRDRERGRVAELLDGLADCRGRLVLVGGEPGIGKTALLEHVADAATGRGAAVHWGRCPDTDGVPPFWLWRRVLSSWVADLDDDQIAAAVGGDAAAVAGIAPEVGQRTGARWEAGAVDPITARFQLNEGAAAFLARSAGVGRVLVLDDLQWADAPSLELLVHLTDRLPTAPLLVVGSFRDLLADRTPPLERFLATVLQRSDVEMIGLRGLSAPDVARMVERHTGRPIAEHAATALADRSSGNPFLLRQLALIMDSEEGDVDAVFDAIPVGARHVVLRRLGRLPQGARRLLDVAAVVGEEFDSRVLATAAGRSVTDVMEDLDVAIRHGLVRHEDATSVLYRFGHALVRDIVRDEIPHSSLVRVHAAVAEALEGHGGVPAAALAEHFSAATSVIADGRPVSYLRHAARDALQLAAYERAEAQLHTALRILGHRDRADPPTELEVRLELVAVATGLHGWTAPTIEEVAAPVRRIADDAGIAPASFPLWWSLWTRDMTLGRPAGSLGLAERLLDTAEAAGDAAFTVAGHVAMAYTLLHTRNDADAALVHVRAGRLVEAEADPARLSSTPEHVSVALRVTEAVTHGIAGNREEALRTGDEAVDVARGAGGGFREAYARLFAAWSAGLVDDPPRVLGHTGPGLATAGSLRLAYLTTLLTPADAWARARLGGPIGEQVSRLTAAADSLRDAGHLHALPQWLLWLADVLGRAGDRAGADQVLVDARDVARTTGEHLYLSRIERLAVRPESSGRAAGSLGSSPRAGVR